MGGGVVIGSVAAAPVWWKDPAVRGIGAAVFFWTFAYDVITPFLPLLAHQLHMSPRMVGYVASMNVAGAAALSLPVALFSDRLGRRGALGLAWTASGVGMLMLGLARHPIGLLTGAFLLGGAVAVIPTVSVIGWEHLEEGTRLKGLALIFLGGPLGLVAGSLAGGALSQSLGLKVTCLVAGLGALGLMTQIRRLIPAPMAPPLPPTRLLPNFNWRIWGLVAAALVIVCALNLPMPFILLNLHVLYRQDLWQSGVYSAVIGVGQVAWTLAFVFMPNRSGGEGLLSTLLLALCVCMAANAVFDLLFQVEHPLAWVVALGLRGSLYSLQYVGPTLLNHWVYHRSSSTLRLTLASMVFGVGSLLAPTFGGWLYQSRGPWSPFTVSAAVLAIAVAGVAAAWRLSPRTVG